MLRRQCFISPTHCCNYWYRNMTANSTWNSWFIAFEDDRNLPWGIANNKTNVIKGIKTWPIETKTSIFMTLSVCLISWQWVTNVFVNLNRTIFLWLRAKPLLSDLNCFAKSDLSPHVTGSHSLHCIDSLCLVHRCVQEYKLAGDGRSCLLQSENCEGPKCPRQDARFNVTLFGEMLHGYNNKTQQLHLGQIFQMTFR